MELLIWLLVLAAGLMVLLKAADVFMDITERLGQYFGIPAFLLGATVVAFGTSLPELVTSAFAVRSGASEIVSGNVIGSNITNILLILGVSAVMAKQIDINYSKLKNDFIILLLSALCLSWFLWDGEFVAYEAGICIAGMIAYLVYVVKYHNVVDEEESTERVSMGWKQVAGFIVSGVLIFLSAKYVVEAIEQLGSILNIGNEVIALTVVALGTSLPELAVSMAAIKKKNYDIVLGNVLGSNIFNTFAVMGIPFFLGDFVVPPVIKAISIPVMLVATVLLFLNGRKGKMHLVQGITFLLIYAYFVGGTYFKIDVLKFLGLQ